MDNAPEQIEPSASIGPLPEAEFCKKTGLARHDVHELRRRGVEVEEGRDWRRDSSGHVHWTQLGQEALKTLLGITVAEGQKNGQDGALGAELEPISLLVESVPKINRRVLCASKKEGGQLVRVRVRDNTNFMKGMEIKARRDPLYEDVYNLEGRGPRYRGRW